MEEVEVLLYFEINWTGLDGYSTMQKKMHQVWCLQLRLTNLNVS